ncbi:MAG: HD domain-containing protein [bacterium]
MEFIRDYIKRDIRGETVEGLMGRYNYEVEHCKQVRRLALRIFDQLADLHGLGPGDREVLGYAALLHDIGMHINISKHHEHSYYILANEDLIGFSESEKRAIALVALNHRKSMEKNMRGLPKIDGEELSRVAKLSAMLRIADGLDRSHTNAVADVHCSEEGDDVIAIHIEPGEGVEEEIWGAERKKDLFEESFGKRVIFRRGPR